MQNLFGFLISDSGHYLFLPITYLVYRVWLLFYLYTYFYTNSPSLRLILLYSINLYLKIKAIETILNRTIYVNLTKKKSLLRINKWTHFTENCDIILISIRYQLFLFTNMVIVELKYISASKIYFKKSFLISILLWISKCLYEFINSILSRFKTCCIQFWT